MTGKHPRSKLDQPLLFETEQRRTDLKPWTVSEVTAAVKTALHEALPAPLYVRGEISNFKRHTSGHVYFTLKDNKSELACVMWRSSAGSLKFQPHDGLKVLATGEIDVFERAGRYQFYVRHLKPEGTGELELAFQQLYRRLKAEGLFDARHKKSVPKAPAHIALVTSPTGAAVADILDTIRRRYPCVTVSLVPVAVQGDAAANEIARALDWLNQHEAELGGIDVVIVGRGGGSLEDLWAFNEEIVARAVFRSRIPIVSAVGHEVDVTISDLVADVRAATPTAAAELVVPLREDVLTALFEAGQRCRRAAVGRLQAAAGEWTALLNREPLRRPGRLVEQRAQELDYLQAQLERALFGRCSERRQLLSRAEAAVRQIEPIRHLARVKAELLRALHRMRLGLLSRCQEMERRVHPAASRLSPQALKRSHASLHQRLAATAHGLSRAVATALEQALTRAGSLQRQLQGVSHHGVLARGYTVTRHAKGGKLVVRSVQVAPGDLICTLTADGSFESAVKRLS